MNQNMLIWLAENQDESNGTPYCLKLKPQMFPLLPQSDYAMCFKSLKARTLLNSCLAKPEVLWHISELLVDELKSKSHSETIATNKIQNTQIMFHISWHFFLKSKCHNWGFLKTSANLTLIFVLILFSNGFSKALKLVGSGERNAIRKLDSLLYLSWDGSLKIALTQQTF